MPHSFIFIILWYLVYGWAWAFLAYFQLAVYEVTSPLRAVGFHCVGFSCCECKILPHGLQLPCNLQGARDSKATGSVVVVHGFQLLCSRNLQNQSNPRPLHWQEYSYPLCHTRKSSFYLFLIEVIAYLQYLINLCVLHSNSCFYRLNCINEL